MTNETRRNINRNGLPDLLAGYALADRRRNGDSMTIRRAIAELTLVFAGLATIAAYGIAFA